MVEWGDCSDWMAHLLDPLLQTVRHRWPMLYVYLSVWQTSVLLSSWGLCRVNVCNAIIQLSFRDANHTPPLTHRTETSDH